MTSQDTFERCEHITGGTVALLDPGVPTFTFLARDTAPVAALLRGMFVQPEVLLGDDGQLGYHLLVPDRRLLLGAIPLPEADLPRIAKGAGVLNVCPTLIVDGDGGSIDLRRFVMDVDHDWSGVHARAKQALLRGEVERALTLIRPLTEQPGLARTKHLQGRCFMAMRDHMAAVVCFQDALEAATESFKRTLLPGASSTLTDLAVCLLSLGRRDAGREVLRHALHLRPNNPEALFMFAGLTGEEEQVVRAAARVLAIGGHEPFVERYAADYAAGTGRPAAEVLERAKATEVDLEAPFVTGAGLGDLDRVVALVAPGAPGRGAPRAAPSGGPGKPWATASKRDRLRPDEEELRRGEELHQALLRREAEEAARFSPWRVLAVAVGLALLALFVASRLIR